MRFSERMGIKKPKELIQIDSMDDDLRNGLWNVIVNIKELINTNENRNSITFQIHRMIWGDYFKLPIDSLQIGNLKNRDFFRKRFYEFKWFEVYDYLEFLMDIFPSIIGKATANTFNLLINYTLKKEKSGFRLVENTFVPITSENEILEIEKVLKNSENYLLRGVQTHFEESLKKLSDKQNPDYRNSIKESISAVESICKIISGKPSATLNDALRHIEKNDKINLHKALKAGFDKIYAYAGDEKGVRHALMDESDLDFEDAKFMLVSCSAFVNYLIVKADKAGIELTSN